MKANVSTQRNTRQKKAVNSVLEAAQRPKSVQQILDRARMEVPRLSLGTVYRIVNAMVAAGELDLLQLPGEPPLFEMANDKHHHYFRCKYCGAMIEIPGREDLLQALTPEGCTVEYHELYLAGKCTQCQQAGCDTPLTETKQDTACE